MKEEKQNWLIVEGATGNVHSARYDAKTRECFVRWGYGDTKEGVTGMSVYRNVSKELWEWWSATFPADVPNGGFFREILQHENERVY